MKQKIITKNLTKTYITFEKEEGLKGSIKSLFKKKTIQKDAMTNFDLEIEEGEFIGLIGQNGAGKTTLIKMLTGIIKPSQGEISVFGYKPYELKDEFKKSYSVVMGQKSQLWWDLPAIDSFLLNKELYEIKDEDYKKNLSFFVELLGVEKLLKIQVRNLSLGERMKMELILALLHNPSILFLDEPTIGLDVIAQKQIRQFLKEINKEKGTTIILTSHYMEDIKYLCDRAVVVRNGTKIYDGSLDSILESYQGHRIITVYFNHMLSMEFDPNNKSFDKYDIEKQCQLNDMANEKNDFEKELDIKNKDIADKNYNFNKELNLDIQWIEKQEFKWVFKIKKEEVKLAIKKIMDNYEIEDISIEDENISETIEKIYRAKDL
jgi:ABC-2 type transport system ATP-binding protein